MFSDRLFKNKLVKLSLIGRCTFVQVNTIESSNDDWDVAVQCIQKMAREGYCLNRWLFSAHLAMHCLVIVSAIMISEVLQNPFIYIVAVMLIGAHHFGLGHIGYHERSHGMIMHWLPMYGPI